MPANADPGVALGVDVAPVPPISAGLEVGPAVVMGKDVGPEPPMIVGSRVATVVSDAAGSPPQATSMKSVVAHSVGNFNTSILITASPFPYPFVAVPHHQHQYRQR